MALFLSPSLSLCVCSTYSLLLLSHSTTHTGACSLPGEAAAAQGVLPLWKDVRYAHMQVRVCGKRGTLIVFESMLVEAALAVELLQYYCVPNALHPYIGMHKNPHIQREKQHSLCAEINPRVCGSRRSCAGRFSVARACISGVVEASKFTGRSRK